jgi:hypothetical protein
MADETTAAAAPAAATNGKPEPGSRAMADWHAKAAAKAVLEEATAAAAGLEAAREAGDGTEEAQEEATPGRRKDGTFLPKGKKAKTNGKAAQAAAAKTEEPAAAGDDGKAADAEAGEPAPAAGAGDNLGGGIGRARKLVREGNIAGALELIGLHPEKLEGKQWGAFRQREKAAQDAARAASEKEQGLANVARQLQQQYGRYDEAQKAYEAEDYDTAFKLAFNETADDYTRKRVHSLHTKTKDPEVIKLRKELDAMRVEKQTDMQRAQEQAAEQGRKQARQTYQQTLATELAEMDDRRIQRVATKKAFIQKVFDIQEQHWNEGAQSTIDTVEAAELAWEELYEGVAGETSTTVASSTSRSAGTAKTPVRQGSKGSTTLNPHEASEASPAHKLKPGSPELRLFYARKAELAAMGEAAELETG